MTTECRGHRECTECGEGAADAWNLGSSGSVSGVGTGMATSEVVEYGYALRLGSVAEAVVCCATRLRYVGVQERCTGMMIW